MTTLTKEQPVESTDVPRGGRNDTHPAFGVATVARSHGTPRTLFQSDLRHNDTIHLTISTADRTRELNHDWTHPNKVLVEVEMSLAQWGALVSSIGIGSGVPVTLRSRETDYQIPLIPFEPRLAESVSEVKSATRKTFERAKVTFEALQEAINSKRGVKEVREALRTHAASLEHAEGNAEFAVKSLQGAAESVVSQARADIEAHILTASILTGNSSIEAPLMPTPQELES